MKGQYLEEKEIEQLDELLKYSAKDTIKCWIATRVRGASSSMACNGNISTELLKALDEHIKPIIK